MKRNRHWTAAAALHLLRDGWRIAHVAQDRKMALSTFNDVVSDLKNGEVASIRRVTGLEEIRLTNGGEYRIVAYETEHLERWVTEFGAKGR